MVLSAFGSTSAVNVTTPIGLKFVTLTLPRGALSSKLPVAATIS